LCENGGKNRGSHAATDHDATAARSNVVRGETLGERVSSDLDAALHAWRETAGATSLRRALVRILSVLEDDDATDTERGPMKE
jgi:hypothetical protein